MAGFKIKEQLTATDKSIIGYLAITFILCFFLPEPSEQIKPLLFRLVAFTAIGIILFWDYKQQSSVSKFLHYFYPIVLLAYIYGETAQFNHLFFNTFFDPYLIHLDKLLVGVEPALLFAKTFPQLWLSETFYFTYFSFYLFSIGIPAIAYYHNKETAQKILFIIINSYILYYLFFILFPTEGPQFYYHYGDGISRGFFHNVIVLIQKYGESHTGAFPSSHVGMMTVFSWIAYKYIPKIFLLSLFLTLLVSFATVYIQAHYLVDVFGGYLSAIAAIYISSKVYSFGLKKRFFSY